MSKIEKALEKAKSMRRASRQEHQGQAPAKAPVLLDEQQPVYTKTKTISLDTAHLEKHRLMTLLHDPETINYYNVLRTQVLQRTRQKGHNTIMVSSVLDGEGKTTTAINLAVSIAKEVKQTVLLVDADLRKPSIHRFLGCNTEKGLSDYLQDNVPVAELLVNPGLAKMVVLPAGRAVQESTELLGSPKMEKLVDEVKRRYPERYVIFDCSPLLDVPDALVLSPYVDGVILVVDAGTTPKDHIRKAVELLEGKNIVGMVLNRATEAQRAYYY